MGERARPRVLIAEPLDAACVAWLASRADVVTQGVDDPGFAGALAGADALIVRTYVRVDGALLEAAPRVRVVGRAGVGLDNIDLASCGARGVRVVHTPGANTQAVVEFVLGVMLDDVRPRRSLDRALGPREWDAERGVQIGERQLSEMTLGILGLGRIGSRLASVARSIGMEVLYHDLREIEAGEGEGQRRGAVPVGIEDLLGRSDVLSVHVDGRLENRGLIGSAALARLKADALVVNTSRGFVVDATALASWLRSRPRARAVLDVHEPEPFGPDYPLLGVPGARLTAHLASGTRTAKRNMSWVVRDVWGALSGE